MMDIGNTESVVNAVKEVAAKVDCTNMIDYAMSKAALNMASKAPLESFRDKNRNNILN